MRTFLIIILLFSILQARNIELSKNMLNSSRLDSKNLQMLQDKDIDLKAKENFYSCLENDSKSCEKLVLSGTLSIEDCEKLACLGIAQIYVKAGYLQDSIAFYEKACGADILQACFEIGDILEHLGDFKGAMMRYNLSCHFGYLPSCRAMAGLYMRGAGVKVSELKARRILNDSCLNGDALSCFELGGMFRGSNRLKAMEFYARGCNLGESSACKEFKLLNSADFNVRLEDYVKDK